MGRLDSEMYPRGLLQRFPKVGTAGPDWSAVSPPGFSGRFRWCASLRVTARQSEQRGDERKTLTVGWLGSLRSNPDWERAGNAPAYVEVSSCTFGHRHRAG